jgi:hypothetical protein
MTSCVMYMLSTENTQNTLYISSPYLHILLISSIKRSRLTEDERLLLIVVNDCEFVFLNKGATPTSYVMAAGPASGCLGKSQQHVMINVCSHCSHLRQEPIIFLSTSVASNNSYLQSHSLPVARTTLRYN